MMKLRTGFILVAALTATVALARNAQSDMDKLSVEFDAAVKNGDLGWFERTAAQDYVEIATRGERSSRREAMSHMKKMFQMGQVDHCKTRVLSAKEKGNVVVAITHTEFSMWIPSPDHKKKSLLKSDATYEEIWSNEHGAWRIHQLKALKEMTTLDGRHVAGGM